MTDRAFLPNAAWPVAMLLVAGFLALGSIGVSMPAFAEEAASVDEIDTDELVGEDVPPGELVPGDLENEFEGDPEAIEYGRERFGQRCVYCHGGGGRGAKGPCLVCEKYKYGGRNEDLFYNIAAGIPNTQMGAFGQSLDGDEILKIMAYLRAEEKKYRAEKAANAEK